MASPPNMSEWLAANPGKTVYDYSQAYPPEAGTALGGSSTHGGPVNYAPPQQQGPIPTAPMTQSAPVAAPAQSSEPTVPSLSALATGGSGGIATAGATPSVDAIGKIAMPGVADAANSMSMAAGAMGGGGAMGNQETNATASMSGLLRALGEHNPPEQSLKLQRRAY